ncbi:MAG: DNA primase [Betaproteobacteria bacterium CG2_30_59_46]|nr:MAG: DNA primase [Betaproteobacteria bacterium CG2_30_59_46]PIQ10411.1 MAG: DNA primase [Hydrogenophilales bacterium CG18_big_fil_WC_8_21_14_2_50_58_12]PIX99720.1 MAG: DNA primase [Hydrogenophilales bacterium CG_4_10_14_3_um_filter_58_23]PJB07783.1 MAG: DNA primase [Hydrogenophilales bacterium CG_4_9_14_3_um_filter_59_35]
MIPQSFVQDLLNRLDIVDVVDRYVPLKKAGANYVACCPFHSEKSPSFSVSPTKQFYHCFGCGAHGSAIGFVMEHQGLGFVETVEELARSVGLTVPKEESGRQEYKAVVGLDALTEAMQHATHYYRDELKRSEGAIAYLKKRGLSGEIAARFGVGYAPGGWQNLATVFSDYQAKPLVQAGLVIEGDEGKRYDRFRDRIMFPILNQKGAVIGFGGRVLGTGEPKYLNSPETPLFEKGRELYGLFQARQAIRAAGKVIVVEGYMDVVALAQHGVEYAVATLGTATTPVHIQKLLRQSDNIVFCFDGDTAGRKAAWRALENSLALVGDEKSIKFLFLPQGEDPDSYIRKEGKAAFEALLEGAMPMSEFLLRELAAGVDMQTMEGRAHFLKLAQPLAQQVAAPALRLMLRQRLAELAGVTRNELEGLIPVKSTVKPAATRMRSRPSRKPPSLARKLLQLLLFQPELGAEFDMSLLNNGSEELKTLSALLGLVADSHLQPTTTVALLERFRGTSHEALLSEVSGEILQWDEEFEVAEEFTGALDQLRDGGRNRRIDDLLALSRTRGLSMEEKQELQRLLQGGSASTKSGQFVRK